MRKYSGWTYPARSGWKVNSTGKHSTVTLKDLGITLKMCGKAKDWGTPTTLTIVYKPSQRQWYASFTVEVEVPEPKFGSQSDLQYNSIVAYDLGTETALTLFDGTEFQEIANPRFTQKSEERIRKIAKLKRRKRAPKRGVKASRRWRKIHQRESRLKAKVARQRRDWQLENPTQPKMDCSAETKADFPHKVTSEIARRYDIGVTEKLNVKGMTRKGGKGKAGLNKSILSVGVGTLNQMLTYKIEQKGGLVLMLSTKTIKPSQHCPKCGAVHKAWAELKNRYHVCSTCGFAIPRDRGSVMVLYNVARNQQLGLGTSLVSLRCASSTSKSCGSLKQLGQKKRQKSHRQASGGSTETPPAFAVG